MTNSALRPIGADIIHKLVGRRNTHPPRRRRFFRDPFFERNFTLSFGVPVSTTPGEFIIITGATGRVRGAREKGRYRVFTRTRSLGRFPISLKIGPDQLADGWLCAGRRGENALDNFDRETVYWLENNDGNAADKYRPTLPVIVGRTITTVFEIRTRRAASVIPSVRRVIAARICDDDRYIFIPTYRLIFR